MTRDPRTLEIYRQIMEWLERVIGNLGGTANVPLELRIPVLRTGFPRSFAGDPDHFVPMRQLAFRAAVDDLGQVYAEIAGGSTLSGQRIYYRPNWRGILTIEEILQEEA
jgi:hypothetical protein